MNFHMNMVVMEVKVEDVAEEEVGLGLGILEVQDLVVEMMDSWEIKEALDMGKFI